MDLYKSAPLIILLPSPSVLSPQTNSICMRTNYILKNNFPSVLTQFLNVCIGYINFCAKPCGTPCMIMTPPVITTRGRVSSNQTASSCCFLQAARRRNCAYSLKGKGFPLLLITPNV